MGRGATGATAAGVSVGADGTGPGSEGEAGAGAGAGVGLGVGFGVTETAGPVTDGVGVGLGVGVGVGRGETELVGVGLGAAVPGVLAGRRMTSTAGAIRRGFRSFTFLGYLKRERPGGGLCSRLLEGLRKVNLPSRRFTDHPDLALYIRGNHAHLRHVPFLAQ